MPASVTYLRLISLGAIAFAATAALRPATAHACTPDFCEDSTEFNQLAVATDQVLPSGVIVLSTRQRNIGNTQDALDRLSIAVLDADGAERPGAVDEVGGVYFWRPDSAFVVGEVVTVTVSDDGSFYQECGYEDDSGVTTVEVVEGQLPELELPSIEVETSYDIVRAFDVNSTLCCDDGFLNASGCGDAFPGQEGFCVATEQTGWATANVSASAISLGPPVAVEFIVDGMTRTSRNGLQFAELPTFSERSPVSFTVQIRVTSVLDGTMLESEVYTIDAGDAGPLGPLAIDASAELEANCESPAYSCDENIDGGWDEDNCTPHSGASDPGDTGGAGGEDTDGAAGEDTDGAAGEDTDGGGCRVGGQGPAGASLFLLALAAVVRRQTR